MRLPESELLARKRALYQSALSDERLREDEVVFRALGIIPRTYDYTRCVIRGFASAVVAFYDTERGEVVIPSDRPVPDHVLVHELVHALQDQHFDLKRLEMLGSKSTDRALAIGALVEGDAIRVEEAFLMIEPRKISPGERPSTPSEPRQDECALPPVLAAQSEFPYTWGPIYLEWLRKTSGEVAPDHKFRSPDLRTLTIMRRAKAPPEMAPRGNASSSEDEIFDELGAFTVGHIFSAVVDRKSALRASFGLLSDAVRLVPGGEIVWLSEWRSNESASNAARLMIRHLGSMTGVSIHPGATRVTVSLSDGRFWGVSAAQATLTVQVTSSVSEK